MIPLSSFQNIPVLGFAAFSGTGKTTLLEQLLPQLKRAGLQLAVVKHTHHAKFDIDKPGKDSYRLRKAGADQMLVASAKRWALMVEQPPEQIESHLQPDLFQLLRYLDSKHTDLILVEGFKHENISKIELHRPQLKKPLLYPDDPNIIAIASDQVDLAKQYPQYNIQCPILNINHISKISDFILQHIDPSSSK